MADATVSEGNKGRFKLMTCRDIIITFHKKTSGFPPYPVFIFRAADGLICGEYDPRLGDNAWTGDSDVLHREIAYWYISRDQQDVDVVQLWITAKDEEMAT